MKVILALCGVVGALAVGVVALRLGSPTGGREQPQPQPVAVAEPADPATPPTPIEPVAPPRPQAPAASQSAPIQPPPEPPPAPSTKADRLAQLRETFRALAAGDPKTALRAAKQLTDETERETALLTLITEWKHGELGPPRRRAKAIANFGLETGLSVELADNPELAILWANELTEGENRRLVLKQAALAMVDSDPAGAIAYAQRLWASDRTVFNSIFTGWAEKDTDAALRNAEQLSDPSQRDAALNAIRGVGIGAELRVQDGFPVINRLLPGMPAELSGQLHPGDCIIGVAQGNNSFVETQGMALSDLVQAIRGAPGTLLQLRIVPADAPPDSLPQTVAIVRGQIKFKQ